MKKESTIKYDDLDFPNEDKEDFTAYINGELFTGVAYEEHKNNYFEYNYLNGQEHGRSYGYDVNTNEIIQDENYLHGQKHEKCFNKNYNKGFESHEFYNRGILLSQKFFNLKGVLIKEYEKSKNIDLEYYENGTLYKEREIKSDRNEFFEYYFLGNRNQWICRKLNYNEKKKQYNFEFNEELIINQIHSFDSKFHWFPIRWFIVHIIEIDKDKAFDFLISLLKHKDEYFKSEAAYFLGELGDKRGISHLEKILNNLNKPFLDKRFGYGGHGNSFTTGKRALMSIKKIRTANSFWKRLLKRN